MSASSRRPAKVSTSSLAPFFFSSRRRHTRLVSDWSSDVCSSDLFPGGLACPLLEKVGRGFHHSNLFGDRCRDPLVQRHAILFREPLGSLLDGDGKLQWIGSFAHGFTFFNSSPGRSTEILNRSAGPAKSATL